MRDYIVKENTALMLFAVKDMNIQDKQKEFLVWSKLMDSFHFDEEAVVNFIYINHPIETYIGISINTPNISLMHEKIRRYSEGLAYLLVFYFNSADIRVLNQDECIAVIDNLIHLNKIPQNLCSADKVFLEGTGDKLKILFARVVDPGIILDKFYELSEGYRRQKADSIESRIGVKPKCDERILTVLKNAYLCYSFNYYSNIADRDKCVSKSNAAVISRDTEYINSFLDFMGVPNLFINKIIDAKSTHELFDNPDIVLVPPEIVAEFILGYR